MSTVEKPVEIPETRPPSSNSNSDPAGPSGHNINGLLPFVPKGKGAIVT